MIITLISGGSGSTNIQIGLYKLFPQLSINLLINGYDDGKSTGVLRKLFPNTLGISDFRKNQILEYELIYGNNNLYKLLNLRFTHDDPYVYLINIIKNLDISIEIQKFLLDNTEYFFKTSQSKEIIYEDFSFMNIIYCSLLHKNHNNIELVCNIIKNLFGLKNNIYINSADCLLLKAITKNGDILLDEGSIVDFNDKNDKIIDIFFDKKYPVLNPKTSDLLLKSDIILFSCGTQFSSLIPTYKTLLFKETIQKSKASKYLIMNCEYDNDIINYSGNDLLDKINEYLPLSDIKIIISDSMNQDLLPTKIDYNYINIPYLIKNKNHDGNLIWKYILQDYFKDYYNTKYIFDYDYTLYDKDFIEISEENITLLNDIKNATVISNNCYSNLVQINIENIYSNFGNIYNTNKYIDESYVLSDEDINSIYVLIKNLNIDEDYKITNRRNISISIKPIKNRNKVISIFNTLLNKDYQIVETGKTTLEFTKKGLSKRNIFVHNKYINDDLITYISDKNDINYTSEDKIKYLEVSDIFTTNLFLKSIKLNIKYDFCIIVGGINKRMNIDYPKCLIEVDNEIVLTKIIRNILPYANNVYICANNYYKHKFIEYTLNYANIRFLYFDSYDKKQNYPRGNGETIYQVLNEIHNLTDKLFILWGDIIISDNKIFEEMYNQSCETILIPTKYKSNPYAYLILDEFKNVKDIGYKKNMEVSYGYHDQCIFLCDKHIIKEKLNLIINSDYEELDFLSIIKYIDNISYYETKYTISSFNTIDEL